MRTTLLSLLLLIFTAQLFYSQQYGIKGKNMSNRLRDLERIKLIEALNMNEETSIRFFSRRNSHLNEQKKITQRRDSLYSKMRMLLMEEEFEEAEQQQLLLKIFECEEQILKNRKVFLEELTEILDVKQKFQYVAFDHAFKKQIQREIQRRGKRRQE